MATATTADTFQALICSRIFVLVTDFYERTGGRLMELMLSDEYPAYASTILEVYGEEVVGFVALRRGVEPAPAPDDLVSFARQRVGAHKYPREIRVVPFVPFTPVGKVDRKALRAMLEGMESQESSAS